MDTAQYLKNLTVPKGEVDVVLDTDTFNEVDDQFAIGYMLSHEEKFNVKGICAAPFFNKKVSSPREGMEKSYQEIHKLLCLAKREILSSIVFRGSESYLPGEQTPVESAAAAFMADLAVRYTPEKPLYIIAIGAITNVASAILKNPRMVDNTVIIWLGAHGLHIPQAVNEFNMVQDIAAARVVMGCGVPLVLLPCRGVVEQFATSRYELEHWLKGKNALCDYLADNMIAEAESYAAGKPWTRVIWDVTAVAWLLNEDNRFMEDELIPSPVPEYDLHMVTDSHRHLIRYVYRVKRDALFEDLFRKLGEFK